MDLSWAPVSCTAFLNKSDLIFLQNAKLTLTEFRRLILWNECSSKLLIIVVLYRNVWYKVWRERLYKSAICTICLEKKITLQQQCIMILWQCFQFLGILYAINLGSKNTHDYVQQTCSPPGNLQHLHCVSEDNIHQCSMKIICQLYSIYIRLHPPPPSCSTSKTHSDETPGDCYLPSPMYENQIGNCFCPWFTSMQTKKLFSYFHVNVFFIGGDKCNQSSSRQGRRACWGGWGGR